MLRKDFDYESTIKMLKSGFIQRTGCPTNGIKEWENAVQLLDNFLLASGVRGHKNWEKEWDTDILDKAMTKILIAVSGKQMTPGGAYEIMEILGKEESLARIRKGIEMLSEAADEE